MRFPVGLVAAMLCGLTATAAAAQAPLPSAALAQALARPTTPGTTALLLPHTAEPAAAERLAKALSDPNPEVRAVAARIAFTTRDQRLLPPLLAALDAESQLLPAGEMMRAVALIAGRAGDDPVFRALARLDGKPAPWLGVVARTRPADVLSRLAVLGGDAGEPLERLATTDGDAVVAAFAGLAGTPGLERAYLALIGRLESATAPLPWKVVALGLDATPGTRRAVARLLLHRRAALPADAQAALARLRTGDAAAEDPLLALSFELVRRAEGAGRTPLGPMIGALDPATFPYDDWRDTWLHHLDPSEEAALRARVARLGARENWSSGGHPALHRPDVNAPPASDMVVRMARPLAPRLVSELGELTGCRAERDQVIAVQVAFKPTGQVREVYAPVGVGVERCGQAARLVAALDIAGGYAPIATDRTDLIMIGFRPEDARCPRVELAHAGKELRVGGKMRAPRKRRNVAPVYPQSMLTARVQGVVLAEALIATSGCVSDATVLRAPNSTLSAAALAAISLWEYEPALLDGKPVPIVMTVTVNFSLQ